MTEASFTCTESVVPPCGKLSRFRVILVLIIMSFDALGTVEADTNETALQGTLIRYGEQSAQIAFATGGMTAGRPSRVENCWPANPFLVTCLGDEDTLHLSDLRRAPEQQASYNVGRPGKRHRLQRVRLSRECWDSRWHSWELKGMREILHDICSGLLHV